MAPPSEKWENGPVISYSGEITDVVDPILGCYVLDKKFDLYLTFHPLVYKGQGLRAGTAVELINLHVMAANIKGGGFRGLGNNVALVACPMSTVVITEFPLKANLGTLMDWNTQHNALQKLKGMSVPDIFFLNVLKRNVEYLAKDLPEEDLWKEHALDMAKTILFHIGFKPLTSNPHKLSSLLSHEYICHASSLRYKSPKFFTIREIVDSEVIRSHTSITNPSRSGSDHRSIRISGEDLGLGELLLLAYLECDSDGNVWIKDSTGWLRVQCPLHFFSPLDAKERRFPLLVSTFVVVVEVFGQSNSSLHIPHKVYVQICDALPLLRNYHKPEHKLDVPVAQNVATVDNLYVLIQHITPVHLRFHSGGSAMGTRTAHIYFRFSPASQANSDQHKVETSRCSYGVAEIQQPFLHLLQFLEVGVVYRMDSLKRTFSEEDKSEGPFFFLVNVNTVISKVAHEDNTSLLFTDEQMIFLNVQDIFRSFENIEQIIDLEGLVLAKYLRAADHEVYLPSDIDPLSLFADGNIGYGRPDRLLVIRLCDAKLSDHDTNVEVVLDGRLSTFFLGIILGAVVRFCRLSIRKSKKGTYFVKVFLRARRAFMRHHEACLSSGKKSSLENG
ncbi:hypothetical protein BC829DRAFT_188528 [Chytridium lagenaria]|nr:hypothetical protein BC829DRAFT_188528 [Chytridium lagenaria]